MDREAWLMLLCDPNDYRSDFEIKKALAGFPILKHIHRSSNVAHVVVKVLFNKEDGIPDEIVVSPIDYPRAPFWMIPVCTLHATNLSVLADVDALPLDGPLDPMPHPAPHWMEGHEDLSQANNLPHEDKSVGNIASNVGGGGELILCPLFTMYLNMMVPSYIANFDLIWHLAKVVEDVPAARELRVIEQFSDVEILDKMPARKRPKKRRARKLKGPLDARILRRSTCLNKAHFFKDDASAAAVGVSEAAVVEAIADI
ncbi:unnamed protein product [Urochloa humidicola]